MPDGEQRKYHSSDQWDMIGCNSTDLAAGLGLTRPHGDSKDLADAACRARQLTNHCKIEAIFDAAKDAEYWYYRNDHFFYALVGIPVIFFTSLPYPEYHTPQR